MIEDMSRIPDLEGTSSNPFSLDALAVFIFRVLQRVNHLTPISDQEAYDKAAIKCNGREAVANFEPSAYENDIPEGENLGNVCNLDLNLGISLSSVDCPNQNESVAPYHLGMASARPTFPTPMPLFSAAASSGFSSSNTSVSSAAILPPHPPNTKLIGNLVGEVRKHVG